MKNSDSLLEENEYLVLISSANMTAEKINECRKEFQKKYVLSNSYYSCDIFLAKFNNLKAREQLLINSINESIYGIAPMFISMKNILEIPKHSFVIPVTSKVVLTDLVKSLKQITRVIRASEVKPYFTTDFHIPLFTKLSSYQFEKMFPECSQYYFNAQFIATEIKILSREANQKSKWNVLKTYQLKKESTIAQPLLF